MPLFSKQPRIAPLSAPFEPRAEAALNRLGPPIALFRVFARRPDLAEGVYGWGSYYLSRKAALDLRQRELVIHRTTALCGADYEWGIHVAFFADKVGFTAAQVDSLARGTAGDPCWAPSETGLLAAVDALHRRNDLDDGEWSGLVDAVGVDGAVEVLLLTGWYHAISYAVNALRLPLEPGTAGIAR